ncbi:MAG: hypothetical protein Q7R66_16115 [Undibacterium sp.]|nr:hypothetical protein [Undibacterium sp.]
MDCHGSAALLSVTAHCWLTANDPIPTVTTRFAPIRNATHTGRLAFANSLSEPLSYRDDPK